MLGFLGFWALGVYEFLELREIFHVTTLGPKPVQYSYMDPLG